MVLAEPATGFDSVPRACDTPRVTTTPIARGTRLAGTLLLADISGYTTFLQGVTEAHQALLVDAEEPPAVYGVMSGLLDTMLDAVAPPFRLVKFEGDALFVVAPADEMPLRGADVVSCLRACHDAFQRRLGEAKSDWTCTCGSCIRIGQLGLKFVLHHGPYFTQRIAGNEELAGPEVIVAHRLLKNHVRDIVGPRPYALLTDAAIAALEVPVDDMIGTTESYEGLPPIAAHVLPLD